MHQLTSFGLSQFLVQPVDIRERGTYEGMRGDTISILQWVLDLDSFIGLYPVIFNAESLFVFVDVQMAPLLSLIRKEDIPEAVQDGHLIGEISQLFDESEREAFQFHCVSKDVLDHIIMGLVDFINHRTGS